MFSCLCYVGRTQHFPLIHVNLDTLKSAVSMSLGDCSYWQAKHTKFPCLGKNARDIVDVTSGFALILFAAAVREIYVLLWVCLYAICNNNLSFDRLIYYEQSRCLRNRPPPPNSVTKAHDRACSCRCSSLQICNFAKVCRCQNRRFSESATRLTMLHARNAKVKGDQKLVSKI